MINDGPQTTVPVFVAALAAAGVGAGGESPRARYFPARDAQTANKPKPPQRKTAKTRSGPETLRPLTDRSGATRSGGSWQMLPAYWRDPAAGIPQTRWRRDAGGPRLRRSAA